MGVLPCFVLFVIFCLRFKESPGPSFSLDNLGRWGAEARGAEWCSYWAPRPWVTNSTLGVIPDQDEN